MKLGRFSLYGLAFLSFVLFLMAAGCATVSYAPTQDNVSKISYPEAREKLMLFKNSQILTRNGYCTITDVKTSYDSVDIFFRKRGFFGLETGETEKETIYFKSIDPSVITAGRGVYLIKYSGRRQNQFFFKNENDAIACSNAIFMFKRRAEGYRPPVDAAAEAAFQEVARNYREAAVKPVLPEEAHKYAVQGDFAVEKKNLPVAEQRYADALKVAPWWPEGHFKRGLVMADLEQYNEAIGEMKKYLLLAPNGKEAREAQDNIYKWESAGSWIGASATSPAAGAGTFTGKVKSFRMTNPLWYGSDVWCRLETVADSGEKFEFIVFKTTLIYDSDGKEISTIKKDKRAEIKYSLITDGNNRTNGQNKAISIRYLE